jgi:hypothetical protein
MNLLRPFRYRRVNRLAAGAVALALPVALSLVLCRGPAARAEARTQPTDELELVLQLTTRPQVLAFQAWLDDYGIADEFYLLEDAQSGNEYGSLPLDEVEILWNQVNPIPDAIFRQVVQKGCFQDPIALFDLYDRLYEQQEHFQVDLIPSR